MYSSTSYQVPGDEWFLGEGRCVQCVGGGGNFMKDFLQFNYLVKEKKSFMFRKQLRQFEMDEACFIENFERAGLWDLWIALFFVCY